MRQALVNKYNIDDKIDIFVSKINSTQMKIHWLHKYNGHTNPVVKEIHTHRHKNS